MKIVQLSFISGLELEMKEIEKKQTMVAKDKRGRKAV